MKQAYKLGLSISTALLLTACGGGGSGSSANTSNTGIATPPSTTANKPALKQAATNAELERLIKQQMLEIYGTVNGCNGDVCIMPAVSATATTAPTAVTDISYSFSSTNTQETNVDEADRIKTDGTYLYTLGTRTSTPATFDSPMVEATPTSVSAAARSVTLLYTPPVITPSSLRIFKANQANAPLVKDMVIDSDTSVNATGLYLDGAKLAVLAEDQQYHWYDWFDPKVWQNQQNRVYLLNVTTAESPIQTAKLNMEGRVISSRRIGSTLYLATRHSPSLPGLNQSPTTEAEATTNRTLINNATLADFLPDYQLNGGSKNEIFSGDDCFMTQYIDKKSYQTSIISLLAIDMNSATPIPQGKCFAGDTETVYASTDAIYLATTSYNYDNASNVTSTDFTISLAYRDSTITTDLHKFSLTNGINYRGSGRVNGHLGWQKNQKPFRMGEHNGVLRVVTFNGDNDLSKNPSPALLTTLQENPANQTLDTLATLPNSTHPQALGKPGEQIYATRFLGDKGYIVTFRTTDPLHLLDLSNPADPYIASELKIDSYSGYLHPVSDNYLLGIGNDAVATDNSDAWRGAWHQGVKFSLIDITNPSSPYEKQKIIVGKRGTGAAISSDPQTLTTLQKGNNLQVALPLSVHNGEEDSTTAPPPHPANRYKWTQDELYRLNINTQTGVMQALTPIVSETASADVPYSYSNYQWADDRSVMIGEFIHYLHGDKVISQAW